MDTPENKRIAEIAEALAPFIAPASDELERARESLDLANRQLDRLRLEDQGWILLSGQGGGPQTGADLDQLKEMSKHLRAAVAESPLPKQANNLRSSYTFSEKFIIPGLEGSTETAKRGAPTSKEKEEKALKAFAQSRTAREFVLGKSAQELISTACSTDSLYLLLGDDTSKEVHALPLDEIVSIYGNEDHPGEVWAYQRQWTPNPAKADSTKTRWYYTDKFTGTRQKELPDGVNEGQKVAVEMGMTLIDLSVNRQTGWALGVPDLWAGHVWNRNYLTSLKDGMEVTSLLAWLTAKVKTQSRSGSADVGVRVGTGGGAGSVQTYGQGNAIDTYATSGKAYDYDALRPIAAIYALAAGVSVVDLLSSPSAAGASYGSAQALAPGMRRAIAVRRDLIASWMERVLEWATGTYHPVTPASIEEVEPYRRMQMTQMAHMTGLFHEDEIRPEMAYLAGITLKHDKQPDGYLIPNNEKSLPRKDVDSDGQPQTKTAPNATQGKSDGTGGVGSTDSNDQRTDNIST